MQIKRMLLLVFGIIFLSSLNGTAFAAGGGDVITTDPTKHFDPKGKLPSEFTIELQNGLRKSLPFEDKRDFDEAKKGFIAAPEYKQIMAEAGHVAWDMGSYEFLLTDQKYDTIHPSLQRQAVLNMAYGLYEVLPDKIYQVRGFDLANITFIKGKTGWLIFDPLTAKETAAAALKFINEQLGPRPVTAVIYSHSHGDHFGGVRGVVDQADVRSGKVPVIAPVGFMDHAVSENVYAGNAMTRRMFYQYGVLLPRSPFGHVDQSIGKNTAAGNLGLIPPTVIVEGDFKEMTVDGVKMIFQNTPGTEAPAEMNTYFPEMKAFWAAENITGTVHNIYTLRGALVRDALKWSKNINDALYHFVDQALEQLISYTGPRKDQITTSDVDEALPAATFEDVWKLTDGLAARDAGRCLEVIEGLMAHGEPIYTILGAVAWHIRRLLNAKYLLERGIRQTDVFRKLGVFPSRFEQFSRQLGDFTLK